MRFESISLSAADPHALTDWYRRTLGLETDAERVEVGETTLRFQRRAESKPTHLAFGTSADSDAVAAWLAAQTTILPVEGEQYRRFEFLDADAIYFDDNEGNVLECLCDNNDSPQWTRGQPVSGAVFDGVTEVGLPAEETLELVEWLADTVGLSSWGTPSGSFAWVGDHTARFVVIPAGREWYPTNRPAAIAPLSATVVDPDATPGRHVHPSLPYEITVTR